MLARLFALSLGLLAASLFSSLPAYAGRLVDLEIINRSTGETLDLHRFRGEQYVAGNPGDRYGLRVVNRTGQRVLVVLSVDGVNVVTGETASPDQSGYVLDPWGRAEISGWRKSLQEVAQFYFTALPDAYAARTGRPDNVGVIGAAVFREKVYAPQPELPVWRSPAPAAMPQSQAYGRAESSADTQGAAAESEALADASGAAEGAQASPSTQSAAADRSVGKMFARNKATRLGTGHGEREYAPTRYTDFTRDSSQPAEVLSVRYDSRPNLMARGVIPKPHPIRPYWPEPRPFPGQFVPDPRG